MDVAIRLDDPLSLPKHLLDAVRQFDSQFRSADYIDNLMDDSGFLIFVEEIETFLRGNNILAYHCTKEICPGYFREKGLRPLNARQHINEFLKHFHDKLTPEQFRKFKTKCDDWLTSETIPNREGKIWFCLSPYLVKDSGTKRFFSYFGGEALYGPFGQEQECLEILKEFGNPVVVKVIAPASDFKVFHQYAFTRDIISHYARLINPEYHIYSVEGYFSRAVRPDEIVDVYDKEVFWATFWPEIEAILHFAGSDAARDRISMIGCLAAPINSSR